MLRPATEEAGPTLRIRGRGKAVKGVENGPLHIDGRNPNDRSREVVLPFRDRPRDVIAIPDAPLRREARSHPMAAVIKEPSDEQCLRLRLGIARGYRIASKDLPGTFEHGPVD